MYWNLQRGLGRRGLTCHLQYMPTHTGDQDEELGLSNKVRGQSKRECGRWGRVAGPVPREAAVKAQVAAAFLPPMQELLAQPGLLHVCGK